MAHTRDYQEVLLEALKDPEEAKVWDEKKTPLFRSIGRRGELT